MNEKTKKFSPDIIEATETLMKYKRERATFDARYANERKIWKDVYSGEESSSWIFNSIVNKHADIIDSIPTCVCLPREKRDENMAEILSKIIPVVAERCDFEGIYSDNAWNKLKYGTAIYGVFWNNDLEEGLGDVDIRPIDISCVFWECGVDDIQNSRNLFITAYEDIDKLESVYPDFRYDEAKQAERRLSGALYGEKISDGKCLVVDWYYKTYDGGAQSLHLCKFVGDAILYCSELDHSCLDGWYEHGEYPLVVDRLYPVDGDLCGFGLISIANDLQKYINHLDKNMLEYTDWASRVRFWAKRSLGVNEKDFLDLDRSIVEVEGDIDEEKLRQIEITPIDDSVIDVKKLKVDELKEVTGARDVSQGGFAGSVTAASAINILREAGAKSSRDGIAQSYRAYVKIIYLVIELIRQFYDSPRIFRITGERGEQQYLEFDGRELRRESGGRPYFDIEVSASKKSPTEAAQKNEIAYDLCRMGAFEPEKAKQTLMMLELMDFDGIENLKATIRAEYLNNDKS